MFVYGCKLRYNAPHLCVYFTFLQECTQPSKQKTRRKTNNKHVSCQNLSTVSSNTSRLVVPAYGKFTKTFYWVIVYRWLTGRPIKRQLSNYTTSRITDVMIKPSVHNENLIQTICQLLSLCTVKKWISSRWPKSAHVILPDFGFTHVRSARGPRGENGVKMCVIN